MKVKKNHEKLQWWWGEKGEKGKQGQQLSEVAWQLPPNTVQGTPTYELTHTLVLPQFQWGHRRVHFEMLSLSQDLAGCVYDPLMGPWINSLAHDLF